MFLFFIISASNTNAQITQEEVLYSNYLNLFENVNLKYEKPLRELGVGGNFNYTLEGQLLNDPVFKSKLSGFWLTLELLFRGSTNSEIEKSWSYIRQPNSTLNISFLLETCPKIVTSVGVSNDVKCIYSVIPYEKEPSAEVWSSILKTMNAFNKFFIEGAYNLTLGNAISYVFNIDATSNYYEAQFQYYADETLEQKTESINKILAIFQKGPNENYLRSQKVDILALNWFTINNGRTTPINNLDDLIGADPFTASVWYCGEQVDGEPDIANAPNSTRIKRFNGFSTCTYFKIAETTITPPENQKNLEDGGITGQEEIPNTPDGSTKYEEVDPSENNLPVCAIYIWENTRIVGCLARIVYYGLYVPSAWLAGLFGRIFDFFVGYSVDHKSYRYDFIVNGWRIIRDLANTAFILILVYTGFRAVFKPNEAGSDMRKIVPNLIVNALIINFSLFATRAVIDASNIGARIFYGRMIVCDGTCEYGSGGSIPSNIKRGWGGYWPLSEKIVSEFDPQRLLSPKVLQMSSSSKDAEYFGNTGAGAEVLQNNRIKNDMKNSDEYAGWYTLVSLLSALIMIAVAVMFFNIAFLFVGRAVGLYILMIFSPIAFLSRSVKLPFKLEKFEWSDWIKELTNYALLAPIFIFFLYIIYSFFGSDIIQQMGLKKEGDSFFEILMSIAIPMAIVFVLLKQAQKQAQKYAGEMGKMVQGATQKLVGGVGTIVGGAAGIAAGGAALLGTTAGASIARRVGSIKVGNSSLNSWAARNSDKSSLARTINTGLNKATTGSWDIRNSWIGKNTGAGINNLIQMSNKAGLTTIDPFKDNISQRIKLGSKSFEGGAVARQKRRDSANETSIKKSMDFSHLTDDQVKEIWSDRINDIIHTRENSYLDNKVDEILKDKDEKYKSNFEKIRKIENLEKEIEELRSKNNLNVSEKEQLEKLIENKNKELKDTDINKLIRENREIYEKERNNNNLINTLSSQPEFKNIKTQVEDEINKEYGKVENVNQYQKAMIADRAKYIRENSMWMKGGKQRSDMINANAIGGSSSALAAGAAAGLAGAIPVVGIGGVMKSFIEQELQAVDNATKKILKDFEKNKTRNIKSKTASDWYKDLESLNETIAKNIRENVENMKNITIREIQQMSEVELKEKISEVIINLSSKLKIAKREYENESKNNNVSVDRLKALAKKEAEIEQELEKARGLLKNRETIQSKIERLEEKSNTENKEVKK